MSQEGRRKRDRFFRFFTHGRPSAARPREAITPSVGAPSTQQSTPTAPLPETQPRVATRDVVIESNPPGSTTATANDTVHTQVGNEGEGQLPTATSNTEAQSLWSRAVKGLSSEEQTLLAGIGIDTNTRQVVSDVGVVIEGIVKNQNGKDWKIRFNGEQIVMRDIGMKILRWADRFKHIGDTIVQYDPGHTALPWAGFRFLLQVKPTFLFRTAISHLAVSDHGSTRRAAESCGRHRTLADGGCRSAWKSRKHWMRSCLELRRLSAS